MNFLAFLFVDVVSKLQEMITWQGTLEVHSRNQCADDEKYAENHSLYLVAEWKTTALKVALTVEINARLGRRHEVDCDCNE
jgi:hypothetical protein